MDRTGFVGYFSLTVSNFVLPFLAFVLPFWSEFSLAGDGDTISIGSGFQGLWTRCFYNGSFSCCAHDGASYLGQYYSYTVWVNAVRVMIGIQVLSSLCTVLMMLLSGIPCLVSAIFHILNAFLALISSIMYHFAVKTEPWIRDTRSHICFYFVVMTLPVSAGLILINIHQHCKNSEDKNVPNLKTHFQCPPYCFQNWNIKKSALCGIIVCYSIQIVAMVLPVWSHTRNSDGSLSGYQGLMARCFYKADVTCCGVITLGDTNEELLKAPSGLGAVWFAEIMAIFTGSLTIAVVRKTMIMDVTRKGTFAIVISSSITFFSLCAGMAAYVSIVRETLGFSFYSTLLSALVFLTVTVIAFLNNRRKASNTGGALHLQYIDLMERMISPVSLPPEVIYKPKTPYEFAPVTDIPDVAPSEQIDKYGNICNICMNDLINTVFLPCGHASCCKKCVTKVMIECKLCPICRQEVERWNNLFLY